MYVHARAHETKKWRSGVERKISVPLLSTPALNALFREIESYLLNAPENINQSTSSLTRPIGAACAARDLSKMESINFLLYRTLAQSPDRVIGVLNALGGEFPNGFGNSKIVGLGLTGPTELSLPDYFPFWNSQHRL
jgi:hypothetical protein